MGWDTAIGADTGDFNDGVPWFGVGIGGSGFLGNTSTGKNQ